MTARVFSPLDRIAILERDGGCLGPPLAMPFPCEGPVEVDHILNGGMGLRGPNTPENGATLCRRHHRVKTENARYWRPYLVQEARLRLGLLPLDRRALSGCVGKRAFATRHEARTHARSNVRTVGHVVPYRCACGAYHVGHRPDAGYPDDE